MMGLSNHLGSALPQYPIDEVPTTFMDEWTWAHLSTGAEAMNPFDYFKFRYYEKWLGGNPSRRWQSRIHADVGHGQLRSSGRSPSAHASRARHRCHRTRHQASEWTSVVGSVADADVIHEVMSGVHVVLHAATLHKPQLAFLPRQAFVDTNVSGTLTLLDAAADAGVQAFVMSSSTTVFGEALVPAPGDPAAWIDESVLPVPKNVYGVTKAAAEDLCQLAFRNQGLPCLVLRVSRFFPEADDMPDSHEGRTADNIKADEYASRRVALEDVVDAHLLAADRAPQLGFGRYIISATTPFRRDDLPQLRTDASAVFAHVDYYNQAVRSYYGQQAQSGSPEQTQRAGYGQASADARAAPRAQRTQRPSQYGDYGDLDYSGSRTTAPLHDSAGSAAGPTGLPSFGQAQTRADQPLREAEESTRPSSPA